MQNNQSSSARWPIHGWLGLSLVLVFWALNWGLDGMRTHWGFFPLWLGYCLVIDALTLRRSGTSLISRSRIAYAGLFAASVPAWWLFELINKRTENWIYLDDGSIGPTEHFILSSIAFSTVIPAVFGTAELVGTLDWLRRLGPGPRVAPSRMVLGSFLVVGSVMAASMLLWPRYFFPFVWLSVFFILEPVNHVLGNRTLLLSTARGDWRPVVALWVGVLICGFFWEMWNFWSYPKWIYDVPFVGFGKVFEMPVLGYGGYLPFAIELFALYHLLVGFLGYRAGWNYLRLGSD